ncbi:MAG: GAF domain-containing protein [Bacteroidota bacterium]
MTEKNKKEKKYDRLFTQIEALVTDIKSPLSRMATINAVLHHKMKDFFWTGFYLLHDGDLLVGPYQGPLACLKLKKNTGVCWAGINSQKPVIVGDVHSFPGHIACDSRSKSELVVPLFNNQNQITGVIDIDSDSLQNFDETDAAGIQKILDLVYRDL